MRIAITGGSGFIGTNAIEAWKDTHTMVNLDWNPPLLPDHGKFWKECDIMDLGRIQEIFSEFRPDIVLHLAARTDTDIHELDGDLDEYIQNTIGTRNVLEAIRNCVTIRQAIITSSMFVCKPGYIPSHDEDFSPFTLYGVSKKISEQETRNAGLTCAWTIIRPQTIWGPWSMRYKNTMFPVMERGLYFHPNKRQVSRAYGYVENVIWQIERIIECAQDTHKKVLYVGDEAINLMKWVDTVMRELTGRSARILPAGIIKSLALTGDMLLSFGMNFPITTTRYDSMTQDYVTTIATTMDLLGSAPFTMEDGIRKFVDWYKNYSQDIECMANRKLIVTQK